jgi:hypothetical protein
MLPIMNVGRGKERKRRGQGGRREASEEEKNLNFSPHFSSA